MEILTTVKGVEKTEEKQVLRKKKYLWFFEVEWWETVREDLIGTEIHVCTYHPVDAVYVNDDKYIKVK